MIYKAPSTDDSPTDTEDEGEPTDTGVQPVTVGEGIISQPNERTVLLLKKVAYGSDSTPKQGSVHDLERQNTFCHLWERRVKGFYTQSKRQAINVLRTLEHPETWDKKEVFHQTIEKPAGYVPPVILGLLLNVLDALSYGKTLLVSRTRGSLSL